MIVKSHEGQVLTKKSVADALKISRSSLYHQPIRNTKDETAKIQIEKVMANHRSYGHRRIALDLNMNKKKILRVMKKYGLKPYRRRIKPKKEDDLNKAPATHQNEIKNICPIRPNIIWVADFTYLRWNDSWYYLATVMDLFTREILGWYISNNHERFLILKALDMALTGTKTTPKYHHSDQGSEYESEDYLKKLTDNQITVSMSQKASPWENGYQESFYSQFKLDLGRLDQFDTIGELVEAIHLQMNYYNRDRIHTSLKMSPVKFKRRHNLKYLSLKNQQTFRQVVEKRGA